MVFPEVYGMDAGADDQGIDIGIKRIKEIGANPSA